MTYIKKTDLAWVAGFTDGDGYFGCSRNSNGSAIQFAIGQNGDKDILLRVKRILSPLGYVSGPYGPYMFPGRLAQYRFVVYGKKKVKRVAKLLWPWLGKVKRRQIRAVFKQIGEPF